MPDSIVRFTITNLHAQLANRLSVQWQGKELDPGPVSIELDRTTGARIKGCWTMRAIVFTLNCSCRCPSQILRKC
jgi:hypothetical protein